MTVVPTLTRPAGCLPAATHETGIALVVVLWMLALLTVIANNLVFSLRTEVQSTANHVSATQASAIADAALARAIYEVARPEAQPWRWKSDGKIHEWAFEGFKTEVAIVDEAAKVDINSASEVLLAGLFRALGEDEAAALHLANAIVDWRDADDFSRPNGAESQEYLAAGREVVPRNANFESIGELQLVLGMRPELFLRAAPHVTVYSGRTGINPQVARRTVLMAVPGSTEDMVDNYVQARQNALRNDLPLPPEPFPSALFSPPVRDTVSIQVSVFLGDNTVFSRETVVRTTSNPAEPVVLLAIRSSGDEQKH